MFINKRNINTTLYFSLSSYFPFFLPISHSLPSLFLPAPLSSKISLHLIISYKVTALQWVCVYKTIVISAHSLSLSLGIRARPHTHTCAFTLSLVIYIITTCTLHSLSHSFVHLRHYCYYDTL